MHFVGAAGYYIYNVIMQTMEEQFGDQLQPSRTPDDIRYYKNEDGSVKGDLPMRAGNGQDTWFLIQVSRSIELLVCNSMLELDLAEPAVLTVFQFLCRHECRSRMSLHTVATNIAAKLCRACW